MYRSAYKNARRLAATESNIAYRTADYERWQQLDFVVGIRVVLSNNHTLNGEPFYDICDRLSAPMGSKATKGRGCYPKTFKFTGWHPLCRCHTETILKTLDEMRADEARILAGEPVSTQSENSVDDVPQEFKDWIKENKERIERAKSKPYFIRDNAKVVDDILNPKSITSIAVDNALVEHLQKYGDLESRSTGMDEYEIYRRWDNLTDEQRIEVIRQGKFTGMLSSEEDLAFSNLYKQTSREKMISELQDQLDNVASGYDMEDTNHYVIKFKGQDKVIYSDTLEKPLTKAQLNKLEYISANSGLSNYRYWYANDDARNHMMHEMGFIEYKDGVIIGSWNNKDFFGNEINIIGKPHYGAAMKLGRKAAKEAQSIIVNIGAPELTIEQLRNIEELANKMGVSKSKIKPMTFLEADEGASNPFKDKENCQSCVVAFSARRRGLNCVAGRYDKDVSGIMKRLGDNFSEAWVNPKTGKTLTPTILRGANDKEIIEKLKKQLSQPGEYVLGYNYKNGDGHVVNIINDGGNIIVHDEQAPRQSERYRKLDTFENIDYLELIRVDKALLNIKLTSQILFIL